jgi:uncharacterized protein YfaS (alpha-2-macroglobulin family)
MIPAVRLYASFQSEKGETDWNCQQETIRVHRKSDEIQVLLQPESEAIAPASLTEVRVSLRDGEGRPRRGFVSLSVVDESLLLLKKDATQNPMLRFRPSLSLPACYDATSLNPAGPLEFFELAFMGGRVVPPWGFARAPVGGGGASPGPSGGGFGGGASEMSIARENFQATAFWLADGITDEDGVLNIPITMPDDLTSWRILAVATGPGLEGGMGTATIRTELSASVEPNLPRFLRSGDRAVIEVLADSKLKTSFEAAITALAPPGLVLSSEHEVRTLAEGHAQLVPFTGPWPA